MSKFDIFVSVEEMEYDVNELSAALEEMMKEEM